MPQKQSPAQISEKEKSISNISKFSNQNTDDSDDMHLQDLIKLPFDYNLGS